MTCVPWQQLARYNMSKHAAPSLGSPTILTRFTPLLRFHLCQLKSLKVPQLKAALGELGLKSSGRKADLIERIEAALK